MKTCYKCKTEKDVTEFGKHAKTKDRLNSWCKSCYKLNARSRRKDRAVMAKSRLAVKKYRAKPENYASALEASRVWRSNNPEKLRLYTKEKRARKLQAVPLWYDRESVEVFYNAARSKTAREGVAYHVDHIVPLKGENVCGLHVQNNLQVLLGTDNISKSNSWI